MRKMKTTLFALLCVLLVFALPACAPGGAGAAPGQDSQTAPSAALSSASAVVPQSEAQSLAPFGADAAAGGAEALRPVAVMVDNSPMARPTSGLPGADVVFEATIFEGLTHFVAVYGDYRQIPVVGPVREIHRPLLQCVLSAQPLMVSNGIGAPSMELIEKNDLTPFAFDTRYDRRPSATWLDKERLEAGASRLQALYTDGEHLNATVDGNGTNMEAAGRLGFTFIEDGAGLPADALEAKDIHVSFSESYMTRFSFDDSSACYRMAQNDHNGVFTLSVDENSGEQLGFTNVLILFADVVRHDNTWGDTYGDLQEIQLANGGEGFYCHGGQAMPLTWNKAMAETPFWLSAGGDEFRLQPGNTYVAIVNNEQKVNFTIE